jgi:hypothetical protein
MKRSGTAPRGRVEKSPAKPHFSFMIIRRHCTCCLAAALVWCALTLAGGATERHRNYPYSIMTPEAGAAPHARTIRRKAHGAFAHRQASAARRQPTGRNGRAASVSPRIVLPVPLPRTELIAPAGGGVAATPAPAQEQQPTIVPGVPKPIPNLPHSTETFQDRASRCAFQQQLYNVPGNLSARYMGACLQ